MKQSLCLAAAIGLFMAAPVLANEKAQAERPAPAADNMIEDSGPFGASWGGLPKPTRDALIRHGNFTEVETRDVPMDGEAFLLSFNLNLQGHSYAANAFFDTETSKFNQLGIEANEKAACTALEQRFIAALGEGHQETNSGLSEFGPYESHSRVWNAKDNRRTHFSYAFIPANNNEGDYCLATFFDRYAD